MATSSVLSTLAVAAVTLLLLLSSSSASPHLKYQSPYGCSHWPGTHLQTYVSILCCASFTECHKAYLAVVADLKSANVKLKLSPDTAHYDVRASNDKMRRVAGLVGTNSDTASTTLKEMTMQMEKHIDLAAGAADAVDDDDENIHRRV
ncbi:hypothetical protein F2Q70_00039643 [Brassica cretica]|uniref:Pectinesterase inhibitor domain-containing protein n=1 Tax=Brassica cretica TaxID=69181 RepID=A0A8S9KBD1_BRACR|nr:hypothetical protein F2Q70_00039643 [Brassica cretica]